MTKEVGYNSPLKDKIEVMQAALGGEQIQFKGKHMSDDWVDTSDPHHPDQILWVWSHKAYRIKPKKPLEYTLIRHKPTGQICLPCSEDSDSPLNLNYELIKVKEILDDVSPITEEG